NTVNRPAQLMMAATVKRLRLGWTLWPASLMLKPWLSTWSITAAQISLEMTIHLLLSLPPPPSYPCPSHPLHSCPPLPLTLTALLHWLSISSKFSIVYQTKQRLKALLCCSPHCKLLNRPECVEILLFVCCRLML